IIGAKDDNMDDAIKRVGNLLVDGGYVERPYIDGMLEREKMTSTYIGMGIAIPHGTSEARKYIHHSGIAVVQYPQGVDFEGEMAYLVVGIAGTDDTHLEILATLSTVLGEEETLEKI